MSRPKTVTLVGDVQRQHAKNLIDLAPQGYRVTFAEPKRSDLQNDLMWVLLGDLAAQVEWHGLKLTDEDWKDMLTASLRRSRVVPGVDGGFVTLGMRTSKMSVREMNDLITLIQAFGDERGVQWTPPPHLRAPASPPQEPAHAR